MNIAEKVKWLQGRQRGVGSSDSPILALGEVFKKTPVDLYISKKRTITAEDVAAEEDNPHLRRGNTYEPLAAAMYEAQSGIKVYAPQTDQERYHDFQVDDPDSPMFADFDGLCADGWVLEIKSPMQRVADSFRTSGIRDYYMIQSAHLAHCANVCTLPFLGDEWKGKIKGTRVVIYECENVALQVVELPLDPDVSTILQDNARRFWREHVEKNVPPAAVAFKQPETKKAGKTVYKQMDGKGWKDAADTYKLAKERELAAKRAMDAAKAMIIDVMGEAGLDAVQVGRHKFLNREQAGRKVFDKKALQADHPDMDLSKYEVRGKPYRSFRYFGPKDRAETGDEATDAGIMTVQKELQEFTTTDFDLEAGVEAFDELRARADLYAAMLEMELGEIRAAIEQAADAVAGKLQ